MPHIISTMTNDQRYTFYKPGAEGKFIEERSIFVKGGANRANKFLITPDCGHTEITDEEAELLLQNPDFKNHVRRGFVKLVDYKAKPNDLEKKDKSAPLTPADFPDKEKAEAETKKDGKPRVSKPKTGKAS